MNKSKTLSFLFLLGITSLCFGQFETIPNISTQAPRSRSFNSRHRTVVTYNGNVCIATPHYDLMPSGQVVFKRGGMRFDGSGYFWSPVVRDNIVRRNHLETRVIGTTNQYWPPVTGTTASTVTPTSSALTVKSQANPYFGTGTQAVTRTQTPSAKTRVQSTQTRARLVKCPNGSYAIVCR